MLRGIAAAFYTPTVPISPSRRTSCRSRHPDARPTRSADTTRGDRPCRTANDILARKGFSVFVVPAAATVREAVDRMNQLKVGAVGVSDGHDGHLSGMFTERDVLRRVVGENRDPAVTRVGDVMTADIVCCGPDTDVDEISAIMKDRRIRHLPVCDGGGDVLGMISIGDVNAVHASDQAAQITYLSEYLYGRA